MLFFINFEQRRITRGNAAFPACERTLFSVERSAISWYNISRDREQRGVTDPMTRDEIIAYAAERYSTDAEWPWDDENFIFRHAGNRKWFAVAMRVPYRRLGIDREGPVDIIDVKCGPLLMDAYRRQPGILPGYHMNKDHWITILLDGTAEDALIRELLEISFDLTNSRPKSGWDAACSHTNRG